MRVLLVDDDGDKLDLIVSELEVNGVRREDIVCARSAAEARTLLSESAFDIMIIDLLLPARNLSPPSADHSIELIRQIIDDGTSGAPSYIVGVTAYIEAKDENFAYFASQTLSILTVAPDEYEWRNSLSGLVKFVGRVQANSSQKDFDVCVLNALYDPEMLAVADNWPMKLGSIDILNQNVMYREGILDLDGRQLRIACAWPSQMGPVAASLAAETVLRRFKPKLLIMTGICGGFAQEVSVGDIVVAERSWDWQCGKWTEGGVLSAAPDQRRCSARALAEARKISTGTIMGIYNSFGGDKPKSLPKLVVGPMVSGSAVVASADIHSAFSAQHRKMAAVDMECYGLYFAAEVSSLLRTEFICIKSVSDLADRDKSDSYQKYCAYLSAKVSLEVARGVLAAHH